VLSCPNSPFSSAHQLGNSLAVLRQYAALGVRYVTLTHMCNNAFADSGGIFDPVTPVHGGLSSIGKTLVREMNRLGVLVDVSHVADTTAKQAIELSRAPVMWSHSSVRALNGISRNVPDNLLRLIRKEEGRDGVVMVNFAPFFIRSDANATVEDVADHVEHIAKVAGRDR
jgi:membrane dipeptidase